MLVGAADNHNDSLNSHNFANFGTNAKGIFMIFAQEIKILSTEIFGHSLRTQPSRPGWRFACSAHHPLAQLEYTFK